MSRSIIFDADLRKFVYAPPAPRRSTCEQCDKPLPPTRFRFCSDLCNTKTWRAANRDKYRKTQERNYHANHDKSVAQYQVKLALLDGRLKKPKSCTLCGQAARYIEAHHHAGYDEKHWLIVTWLCKSCHGKFHRKPAAA